MSDPPPQIAKELVDVLKQQAGVSVSPDRQETITPEPPDEENEERIEFFSYIDRNPPFLNFPVK